MNGDILANSCFINYQALPMAPSSFGESRNGSITVHAYGKPKRRV